MLKILLTAKSLKRTIYSKKTFIKSFLELRMLEKKFPGLGSLGYSPTYSFNILVTLFTVGFFIRHSTCGS